MTAFELKVMFMLWPESRWWDLKTAARKLEFVRLAIKAGVFDYMRWG